MDKRRITGIALIIIAVMLVLYLIFSTVSKSDDIEETTSKEVMTEIVTPISFESSTNNVSKETDIEEQTIDESAEKYYGHDVEGYSELRIDKMNQETLTLLGGNEQALQEAIQIYANGTGFAGAGEAHYYGEVTINQNNNTVIALFYFYINKETTMFEVIYNRQTGKLSCEAH